MPKPAEQHPCQGGDGFRVPVLIGKIRYYAYVMLKYK